MKKRKCVHCGFLVKSGGDRHANKRCPPSGRHGERYLRQRRRKRRAQKDLQVSRGVAVAGTGRPKGAAKQ